MRGAYLIRGGDKVKGGLSDSVKWTQRNKKLKHKYALVKFLWFCAAKFVVSVPNLWSRFIYVGCLKNENCMNSICDCANNCVQKN